jgi:alpha-galactosidase
MDWTLHGATTSYVVRLVDNRMLALDYWGPKGGAGPWPPRTIPLSYQSAADLAPLEYASAGTRHVHRSELLLEHDDGITGAAWSYLDHELSEEGGQARLSVRFADDTGRVELTQHTLVRNDSDVVQRWVDVRNTSASSGIRLDRVLSAAWSVHAPEGARLHYLTGSWGREFDREVVELKRGVLQIRC